MSCLWCFEEQSGQQSFAAASRKSLPYRNPYIADQKKKNKQLSGILEQKISLRKKQQMQISNFPLESSQRYKTSSLRNATSPNASNRPAMISQNNKNMTFYQQKKQFLPSIHTPYTPKTSSFIPPITFTTNLNKSMSKISQNYQKTSGPMQQNSKKLIYPRISFTHHEIGRTPRINNHNSNINSYSNESLKIITIIKSPQKYEVLKTIPEQQNVQFRKQQNMKEQSKLQKRWSLQNNAMNPEKEESMIESGNVVQLKKHYSTSMKMIQDNLDSKLVKSTRGFNSNHHLHHIDDIQCKKTVSVADAHKSSDQYSQIIRDDDFPSMKKRKMTSSQTNILKSQNNSLQQFKRSIAFKPSRKQSRNQQ